MTWRYGMDDFNAADPAEREQVTDWCRRVAVATGDDAWRYVTDVRQPGTDPHRLVATRYRLASDGRPYVDDVGPHPATPAGTFARIAEHPVTEVVVAEVPYPFPPFVWRRLALAVADHVMALRTLADTMADTAVTLSEMQVAVRGWATAERDLLRAARREVYACTGVAITGAVDPLAFGTPRIRMLPDHVSVSGVANYERRVAP